MGLGKAKNYLNTYGTYPVKVRIGKYLSIGGLAMGIFMTVYFGIYLIGVIAGVLSPSWSLSRKLHGFLPLSLPTAVRRAFGLAPASPRCYGSG